MTAQRWWVRLTARWLARIDGVKGQVQMLSLAVTAFSTFSIMLQGFGMGGYVPFVGVGMLVGGVIYTYLFTEGGVWNQVARDRQDLSANFIGPNAAIQAEANMRLWSAANKERELTEAERQAIRQERRVLFNDLRDGIDIADD